MSIAVGRTIVIAAFLVVWATLTGEFGGTPVIDPLILPTPIAMLKAMRRLFAEERLWADVTRTVGRLAGAIVLACGVGVPVGLLLGMTRRVYASIEGPIHALRSVPAAALFPLFLLAIGVGDTALILLASYNSVVVVLIHTVSGSLLANERRLHQAEILGLNRFQIATQVVFFEALPHVLSGVRVATGYALALIIAAEMFIGTSQEGLGRKIFDRELVEAREGRAPAVGREDVGDEHADERRRNCAVRRQVAGGTRDVLADVVREGCGELGGARADCRDIGALAHGSARCERPSAARIAAASNEATASTSP